MRISTALFALSAASVAFGRQCDICPAKVMKGKTVYYLANNAYDRYEKIYICGYQEHLGDANNEGDWNCIYNWEDGGLRFGFGWGAGEMLSARSNLKSPKIEVPVSILNTYDSGAKNPLVGGQPTGGRLYLMRPRETSYIARIPESKVKVDVFRGRDDGAASEVWE
ncbi:hypothetical protein DFH06DRAFT_1138569 [Mycena polygramma]|nr:hypothetical protein DFH06DRAFT_1138569 [Mycena polygramma]